MADTAILQDPTPPLPVQLSIFNLKLSRHCSISAPMLRALAVAGLQRLVMALPAQQVAPSLCSAMSCLQSLRQMDLTCSRLPQHLAAAVGQLRHLVGLKLYLEDECMDAAATRALPASLRSLHVNQAEPLQAREQQEVLASSVDVSQLTALSRLELHDRLSRAITLALPPQPLSLVLWGNLAELSQPCELISVHLAFSDRTAWQGLRQLASQTCLTDLCVECDQSGAACWDGAAMAEDTAPATASVLGQLTGLSCLEFCFYQHEVRLPLLQQLPLLQNLQRLDLSWAEGLEPADIVHLSKLAALTSLCIDDLGKGLDDFTAVAVLGALTRLRHLHLDSQQVKTWSVLPVIARLTYLRSLWVRLGVGCANTLTPVMLQHLSPLTGLTYLNLPAEHLPGDVVQQYLAAMPCLAVIIPSADAYNYDAIAFPLRRQAADVFDCSSMYMHAEVRQPFGGNACTW